MTTVFISGTNSGIGKGLVEKYLQHPNTTVIGSVRDPNSAAAKALHDLPMAEGSKVIIVKIESTSETDAMKAVKSLSSHGITKLDIVIANAGIFKTSAFHKVAETKTSDLLEHFNVNAAGPVRLFQATLPLLNKAAKPKFMLVSTAISTITGMDNIPDYTLTSYGASKAAMNFLVRRIHFENKDLIAFAIHPGLVTVEEKKLNSMLTENSHFLSAVKTDEGNAAVQFFGLPMAFVDVEDSVNGLIAKLDAATREGTSGRFLSFDDTPMAW